MNKLPSSTRKLAGTYITRLFTKTEIPESASVWIYYRVANNQDDTLRYRRDMLYNYAERHNLNIIGESSDIASGLNYDRGGLSEMLTAVKSGIASAVLIRDLTRIGRDVLRTISFVINEIEAHGAVVLCVNH